MREPNISHIYLEEGSGKRRAGAKVKWEKSENTGNVIHLKKKKKSHLQASSPSTDPSKYGFADVMFSLGGLGATEGNAQDALANIDVQRAIEALRRYGVSGGQNALL